MIPERRLLKDQFEMVHCYASPLWQGSIPQRLILHGGMSLEDLNDEISRGESLEKLKDRIPEVMNEVQIEYLHALRRDRAQLVARRKL